MRRIKLYSAISLDGKIARPDGDVSWLHDIPNPHGEDHGYAQFIESVDTTVMGNNTYKQILGFEVDFPYGGKKNYVLTTDPTIKQDENVRYLSQDIPGFMNDLKKMEGKDIWLIGGSQINTLFLENDLIDELLLFIIPVIIGDGIPLFNAVMNTTKLQLEGCDTFSTGMVGLYYNIVK